MTKRQERVQQHILYIFAPGSVTVRENGPDSLVAVDLQGKELVFWYDERSGLVMDEHKWPKQYAAWQAAQAKAKDAPWLEDLDKDNRQLAKSLGKMMALAEWQEERLKQLVRENNRLRDDLRLEKARSNMLADANDFLRQQLKKARMKG